MNRSFIAIALTLVLTATSAFAQADENVPKDNLKLKKAPNFKLKDQNGKEQSLNDMLKKSSVALVFYRSASW